MFQLDKLSGSLNKKKKSPLPWVLPFPKTHGMNTTKSTIQMFAKEHSLRMCYFQEQDTQHPFVILNIYLWFWNTTLPKCRKMLFKDNLI